MPPARSHQPRRSTSGSATHTHMSSAPTPVPIFPRTRSSTRSHGRHDDTNAASYARAIFGDSAFSSGRPSAGPSSSTSRCHGPTAPPRDHSRSRSDVKVYLYRTTRTKFGGSSGNAARKSFGRSRPATDGEPSRIFAQNLEMIPGVSSPPPCPQRYRCHLEKSATQTPAMSWRSRRPGTASSRCAGCGAPSTAASAAGLSACSGRAAPSTGRPTEPRPRW